MSDVIGNKISYLTYYSQGLASNYLEITDHHFFKKSLSFQIATRPSLPPVASQRDFTSSSSPSNLSSDPLTLFAAPYANAIALHPSLWYARVPRLLKVLAEYSLTLTIESDRRIKINCSPTHFPSQPPTATIRPSSRILTAPLPGYLVRWTAERSVSRTSPCMQS